MKTHDIEIQRLVAARHDKGVIELDVDALVLPRPARDEGRAASRIRLELDDARALLLLLKQRIAELDATLPRSRRSGRS